VCRVYVEDLLAIGVEDGAAELQPLKYRVIRADQSYCGEIDLGITFKVTFEWTNGLQVQMHVCYIYKI